MSIFKKINIQLPSVATSKYLLRHNIKMWLSKKSPLMYAKVHELKSGMRSQFVCEDTDIVIDGFPGSANSFVYRLVKARHKGTINIATHIHFPSQIHHAVHLKKPVLLLVRSPNDAVLSFVAKQILWGRSKGEFSCLSDADLIRRLRSGVSYYTAYYDQVQYFTNHVFVADFNNVVKDLASVLFRFNNRFNTDLDDSPLTSIEKSRQFPGSKYNSKIYEERKKTKEDLRIIYNKFVSKDMHDKSHFSYQKILQYVQ